jgi:hypothetical protein
MKLLNFIKLSALLQIKNFIDEIFIKKENNFVSIEKFVLKKLNIQQYKLT